jgi:hypothetical protein
VPRIGSESTNAVDAFAAFIVLPKDMPRAPKSACAFVLKLA